MKHAEFSKVTTMLAKEHKITINTGNCWAANIKARQVFYRKEDIYNLSEEHILGLTLHEIAHIHYTVDVPMPQKNAELTHATLNMLEDIAVEDIIGRDYPNAEEILTTTRMECLDVLVRILPKLTDTSLHEKALLYAATRFQERGYSFQVEKYEQLGDKVAQIMKKRQSEIYGRKQTKDLMPLAETIVQFLLKEAGTLTDQEKNSMMGNSQQQTTGGHSTNEKIDGTETQDETKRQIIEGLKAGTGWKEGPLVSTEISFIDEISDQAATIGKQLRSILKRNNSMEFGGRYRTGKLLTRRLVRIKTIKDRRPFAKRIIKSNQSYAFALASDVSGSMFTRAKKNPASYALSSMHMVGEALRLANVPRALIVFGTKTSVISHINKKQINWNEIAASQKLHNAGSGGTNINCAIEACTKQLERIRAERKIMIILTDGQSDLDDMKNAHKKAVDAGIECLGITIGSGNEAVYMNTTFGKKKNTLIQNTENTKLIGQAFIDILRSSIKASPQ